MRRLSLLSALLLISSPATASIFVVTFSGPVSSSQGDVRSGDVQLGDIVRGSFSFDADEAQFENVIPLGGGTTTVYSTTLRDFDLHLGSYSVVGATQSASLYYQDEVFGSDAFGFALSPLPGGPFGSSFGGLQLQARGDANLIDDQGLTNGLPFDRSRNSFFAAFNNDHGGVRLYGDLNVSALPAAVPEAGTWGMMLFGFSMVGLAMQQRRKCDTALS